MKVPGRTIPSMYGFIYKRIRETCTHVLHAHSEDDLQKAIRLSEQEARDKERRDRERLERENEQALFGKGYTDTKQST